MLIGSSGQLGSSLLRILSVVHDVLPLTSKDIDVRNLSTVHRCVSELKPTVVINTAALHKPVDSIETKSVNAFATNAIGARNLAVACKANGVSLAHISTDYVYGADEMRRYPYRETDAPGPINVYGVSKLAGEYLIRSVLKRHYIFRTSGLYDTVGRNFVNLMLDKADTGGSIRVVDDQVLTPTYVDDLSQQIAVVLEEGEYGLYHATSQGRCTWYQFALEIFALAGRDVDIGPAATGDFGEEARRPAYSVLENQRLRQLNLDKMRHWRDALAACLEARDA
jgi:dTDP-4-dehydrorhamnose reductase